MPPIDIAGVVAAVTSPLQLAALGLILVFLFACLVWIKPRRRRDFPTSQESNGRDAASDIDASTEQ